MPFRSSPALLDRTVLITQDSKSLELHGANRLFSITEENYGFPPVDYITQRGPFQHGESVIDAFLRPRAVQIVVRWSACSRADYWNNRNTLIDFVRPRKGVGLSLRKYLANGAIRQLDVVPDSAPVFGPRDTGVWDEFAFQEPLKFIAHDPVWYDPSVLSAANASSASCSYAGDWPEYPTLRVDGPIADPIITNTDTGEILDFTGLTLASGTHMIVVLAYGKKSAKLGDGTNLIGYLTGASALGTFHLAPDPEVSSGTNVITLSGSGTDGSTLLTVSWYNRYMGI